MAEQDQVADAIDAELARAGEKLNREVKTKLANAVKDAINPPIYKQGKLYAAGAVGLLAGAIFFGGEGIDKDDHTRIVGEKDKTIKELQIKLANTGKVRILASPFASDTSAMVQKNSKGERVLTAPLEFFDRSGQQQTLDLFEDVKKSSFIGEKNLLAFDANNQWADKRSLYPNVVVFYKPDAPVLQSTAAREALYKGIRDDAMNDVKNYKGQKITYRFKGVAATATDPAKVVVIRDIKGDNEETVAGDMEAIKTYELR